jgi:UDP-N-acetylmuramate dehydrogenase
MTVPSERPVAVKPVPRSIISNALSTFRTKHIFRHFASFSSPDEFLAYRSWAREHRLPLSPLPNDRFYISSSTGIGEVLRVCREQSRASFYYLASVPASIGGALTMNAGRGAHLHQTIYDFVESVTILADDQPVTLSRSEIDLAYRWTPFLDRPETLVLGATFCFPPTQLENDPVAERLRYCKDVQDPTAPNCGSAFSVCDMRIMGRLRGLRLMGAAFSSKTNNWILNRSKSSLGVRSLLGVARALHWVRRRTCKVEYVCIR